ncbi:hypothetical protein TUM19329_29970 [Legionella antarctica]|uniref:TIGR02444 family protein n=2 Tax=Legionella antarctica TaxID=2708020 RepID=A0A6F8T9H5_9GAMM|nr:hypothetical protein TUM19329_29970 [Legionella antarctica]
MIKELTNPLWDYSLKIYTNKDVKLLCITLQDDYDINVNIVLWCCWYASELGPFSHQFLNQVLAYNAPWHNHVTRQLRQARQWLRTNLNNELIESFRQDIIQLEITSEAFQQNQLYELSIKQNKAVQNSKNAARANLQNYFNTLTTKISDHHWQLIETKLLTRVSFRTT